jgi:4-hydroxy-tetrahydrodipicolinate reductase
VTRVIVSGICGRMGSMVANNVVDSDDMILVGGVEVETHESVGRPLCDVWGRPGVEVRVRKGLDEFDPGDFDVLIDFSVPAQAVVCAEKASATGAGLVLGTTGLTDFQMAVVQKAAERCPLVVAPNTSLGVNVLFALAARVREALGAGFDIEIVEAHHRGKRDAPSGTAAKLVEVLSGARGLKPGDVARLGRAGGELTRSDEEIGVHSLRGGAIVGRHDVHFISDLEELTLSHQALSREAFARGAVRAARFVAGKPPGLYDMIDVLGLREGTRPEESGDGD